MTTTTPVALEHEDEHQHRPYSYAAGRFRCLCGAVSYYGDGPWFDDGTRACRVCALPTTRPDELCDWHALIVERGPAK